MFKKPPVSQETVSSPTESSNLSSPTETSRKWIWGAVGFASLLALGFAVSWRNFSAHKKKSSKSEPQLPDRLPPYSLTKDWQLIETIDDALQAAHIDGVDVYVKHGKVMLVAASSHQAELSEALRIISSINGVKNVEASIREIEGEQAGSTASK